MAVSEDYRIFLGEQLAGLGPVAIRAMFGGAGLYHAGLMFGLLADDRLYFKCDATTRGEFEAEGMEPFVYRSRGKTVSLSYWRVPDRLYDDPEALCVWARKALAVAGRAKDAPAA